MTKAPIDLIRALAVLAEPATPAHGPVAEALGLPAPPGTSGHADLFLFQLHPYASVHLGPEGMLGGEARDRVAGFWRAVGRTPPAEPDHLVALLGLWAALMEEAEEAAERAGEAAGAPDGGPRRGGPDSPGAGRAPSACAAGALVGRAASALLHEHLLPWLPPFLDRVASLGDAHQRGWALLLRDTLVDQAGASAPPTETARHLQGAPALPDPRRGEAEAFVPGLLAPLRSGMILTRHDLAVLARRRGLGLRAGERRYALEHLLGLEPAGVLEDLGEFARRAARAHDAWPETWASVRTFWTDRAEATARLLGELAEEGVAA